eukprot:UN02934
MFQLYGSFMISIITRVVRLQSTMLFLINYASIKQDTTL